MPWKHNSRTISEGRSWTSDDGLKHPQNWASCWSDADKKSFGLTWEDPPAAFDRRFYWDANTAKPLDDLKTQWVTNTKQTANSLLSSSDWYVTRKAEKSTAIPSAITTHRDAVRTKQASMETAITNAADTPALETLYTYTTTDGVTTRPLGNLPTLGD